MEFLIVTTEGALTLDADDFEEVDKDTATINFLKDGIVIGQAKFPLLVVRNDLVTGENIRHK